MNRRIRAAAIDIGTNTLLMIIADIDEYGNLKIIRDEHAIPRLGKGVNEKKLISPESIGRSSDVLIKYRKICDELNVEIISVCGTSALREASNGKETADVLSEFIKSPVQIITGEEEARLSFMGAAGKDEYATVIDIGGGSTEIITGINDDIQSRVSLNIGAVRLTENFIKKHPPTAEEMNNISKTIKNELKYLDSQVNVSIQELGNKEVQSQTLTYSLSLTNGSRDELSARFYAVAGTPTTIAAIAQGLKDFEYEKIHGYKLSIDELSNVISILLNSDLEKIIEHHHVHPQRADVITAGAIILRELMEYLEQQFCIVSATGLRYGIIKEMIRKNY